MKIVTILSLLLATNIFVACSGEGKPANSNDAFCEDAEAICNSKATPNVQWENIPKSFNPEVDKEQFSIASVRQIQLKFSGFRDDVDLFYSENLASDVGEVEVYTVRGPETKNSFRGTRAVSTSGTLTLSKFGNYNCNINIENRKITALEGACYVRIVITLPMNARVEIYNGTRLISNRFHAMSNDDFLKYLSYPANKDEKKALVDDYVKSYQAIQVFPRLSDKELETALGEFAFGDDKLDVFTKLHLYVQDRESLRPVIRSVFNASDEIKALKIAKLPEL